MLVIMIRRLTSTEQVILVTDWPITSHMTLIKSYDWSDAATQHLTSTEQVRVYILTSTEQVRV